MCIFPKHDWFSGLRPSALPILYRLDKWDSIQMTHKFLIIHDPLPEKVLLARATIGVICHWKVSVDCHR